MTKEKQLSALKDIELEYLSDIDLEYALKDSDDYEEFREKVQELIYEKEIIYYGSAIEFLRDKDPSFKESLEYAFELGYTCDKLNSEVLATILYQRRLEEELYEKDEEFEALFED